MKPGTIVQLGSNTGYIERALQNNPAVVMRKCGYDLWKLMSCNLAVWNYFTKEFSSETGDNSNSD